VQAAIARQLARPRGWFGRTVVTRALNRGNRDLVLATLEGVPLGPGTRLLDVGFGGGLLLELACRGGVRRLTGVDPSEDAVAWLRGRAGRWTPGGGRGAAPGQGALELRLQVGAVEALPVPDAAFDVVASTNTVYFWPDLARAFAELGRALAPGGILAVGFSSQAKLRSFGGISQHGFHFHADESILGAARQAGLLEARLIELHGRVTEGDRVLRATR
jgi:SAM-dependent methyltransferase